MRVHGGTTGILAAILFGRLDPYTGRDAKDFESRKKRHRSEADWRQLHRRIALRLRRRA